MSLECSECERDIRGGHDPSCSRHDRLAEIEYALEVDDLILHTEVEWLVGEVKRYKKALDRIAFGETGHFENSPRSIAINALEPTHAKET